MVKFIVKINANAMGMFLILMLMNGFIYAQSSRQEEFNRLLSSYPEVELPVDDLLSLKSQTIIDAKPLNVLLFGYQDERAKHYVRDTLYRITSYGKVSDEPFEFNTVKRVEGKRVRYDTLFHINVYALGKIEFGNDHVGLITRVVGFMTDYIDIYLFEKSTGKFKSLINAFEATHARNGYPDEGYEEIYNTTRILANKQIEWHQERYNVTTDRLFDVSPDGYFRVIDQKSEGEFEY
ncbi:hypothetical protein [Marinoscillum sp. MHG1-6]|uniref:hypothetical protein n=1 Tax=Marinoscillum sp. MHG1-6 TaxID=2959627 RepID=UPI002157CEC4|nr:hypothetical protein [Marinoscillum sp. MHG1-6]